MRERATVQRLTGKTRHVVAGVDVSARIASVEIEPTDNGCYLHYLDIAGKQLADTWHETRELAKRQARFEFGIDADDWQRGS